MELKRIAFRKLFKQVPGLQDAKNGPKRTENVENPQKSDFAGFLAVLFAPYFSSWGVALGFVPIFPDLKNLAGRVPHSPKRVPFSGLKSAGSGSRSVSDTCRMCLILVL